MNRIWEMCRMPTEKFGEKGTSVGYFYVMGVQYRDYVEMVMNLSVIGAIESKAWCSSMLVD
jgi:hypothetical protein